MAKSPIRKLQVLNTQRLTPNMQRITLGGEDLAGFPIGQDGVYFKLMFPQADISTIELSDGQLPPMDEKPLVRTYTIIEQRLDEQEIDVDFVLHPPPHGPASAWAAQAKINDEILISGPGAKKSFNRDADWFFIVGDMTAIPAISVILESLPNDANGYLVLEIMSDDDRQELTIPSNMNVHWVINTPEQYNVNTLSETVKNLPFLEGKPSVWVACEFSVMRTLRQYFKFEKKISKEALYISSYWKKGLSEDKHKLVKRKDTIAQS